MESDTTKNIEGPKRWSDTINWHELLTRLWQEGKTAANLSQKGIRYDKENESYIVKHHRRKTSAILYFQSISGPQKRRIVILANPYIKPRTAREIWDKWEISPTIQIQTELEGQVNDDHEFICEFKSGEDAAKVDEILKTIAEIGDIQKDIKSFRVKWNGDITQLLPFSLLHQYYDMVRVSPEGDLVVLNYRHLSKNGTQPEKHERESGNGIQKAINIKEGMLTDQDPENIEISIEDKEIRDYITAVIEKTNLSPHHPLFRELYDWYGSILLQVKNTRDALQHLIPVQFNETLRVKIGGHQERACYQGRSTYYAKEKHGWLQEEHYQSSMVYPKTSYKPFHADHPTYLEIKPLALRAETRHHIHQLNLDGEKKELPKDAAGLAMTELIDDMQGFRQNYRFQRKKYLEKQARANLISAIYGRDHQAKKHPQINNITHWHFLTIVDSESNIPGITGHAYTLYVIVSLAEKFAEKREPLSVSEIEMIDKAIFDFLSNMQTERPNMPYIITSLDRTKRLIKWKDIDQSANKLFQNELTTLQERLHRNTEIQPEELDELYEMATLYTKHKKKLTILMAKIKKLKKDQLSRDEQDRLTEEICSEVHKCTPDYERLKELMTKHMPYKAPDGKKYPSLTAYCLDPDVLYEKIIKRFPQLDVGR